MIHNQDHFWWKNNKGDIHKSIYEHVTFLEKEQSYRNDNNLKFLRLYGNAEIIGMGLTGYSRVETPAGIQNRVTLNIIQSMCDTVTAKIAKNTPRPMFLTSGGDWSIQRKAKKLNKFCEGQFYSTQIYEYGKRIFLDSTIFGTGVLKIFRKGNKICVERVFPNEIIVDDAEAIYGDPRTLHQVKWVHKEVLKAQYPRHVGFIDQISDTERNFGSYKPQTQMIKVTESWHLPSTDDSKDGRHCITIENATLFDEKYTKNYFPFVFLRWAPRPLGFFGQGLAEQLVGIQVEINKILKNIQIAMHLGCVPKILLESGSKIIKSHLNNDIGTIVTYTGTKPDNWQLLQIPPELFSHLDRLYSRAYEIAGVSQLSAQSKKPAGLDSGKALREFNDIETERFILIGQAYERFYLDAARQMIDHARDIANEEGKYKVQVKGKRFFETIDWKEIDLEEDQYIMQCFPISGLSNTPSARLQEIQEYIQAGFLTKEAGIKLLNFPDLESDTNLIVASVDDIEHTIDTLLDGEYVPPEPYQNLELGKMMVQMAYLRNKSEGAPEEVLELLRNWITDAEALLQSTQAPPEQPTIPSEIIPQDQAPLAEPEALPTSDLLPVA